MQRARGRLLRHEDFLDGRLYAFRLQHLAHAIDRRLTIPAFRNTKNLDQQECSFASALSKTGQPLFLPRRLRSALHFRRPAASSASSFCSSRILERTSINFVCTSSLT